MRKYIITMIIFFSLISCKKQPTFCENPYKVNEIKLVPTKHWSVGREITIKNDSLINFITQQLCDIKDVSWATDNRLDGETIEIQLIPNNIDEKIYVVMRGYDYDDHRFREGRAYFKNDLLCELVLQLTRIKSNKRNINKP